jgi:hypothetical protein
VRLADGRRVRLPGINAPETAKDAGPDEPFAQAAMAALERILPPGTRLGLRLETDAHDRYGRLLAHLFLADGTNVQAQLLRAGLVIAIVVPPNGWSSACYGSAENAARRAQLGLWAEPRFAPTEAARLPEGASGFHLVRGRVARVGESRGNLWLNLAPRVTVRIPKPDLQWFELDPRALEGRRVEARGWLARRNGELRMTIRHPFSLHLLD